jgi:hypothetical protein
MRSARAVVVVAFVLLAAACGSDSATSSTTAPSGNLSTTIPTGGLSTTIPTGGGALGGANGSVTFTVTGDYETSGEFDFIPLASVFADGGWSATFTGASGDSIIAMNTTPGSLIVSYGDLQVVIAGTEDGGCTFDFSRNDAGGLAGTFSCPGIAAGNSQTGSPITVTFNGSFDAHV